MIMMHRWSRILFVWSVFALFTPMAVARDWAQEGWEFVSEKDGIRVFRKSYPNSAVKGVAGETLIEGSIAKILWIMLDHPHKPEWINRFKEAHTVEDHPPAYNVQYSQFNLPFPASNRDFVFRNDFSLDPATQSVIIDVKSVENQKVPEIPGVVRGEIVRGRYVLIPRGDKTLIQAEYLADPKGLIPSWLINLLQKEWPYKTLEAMRQQVKKPYVQDSSVYQSLREGKWKS